MSFVIISDVTALPASLGNAASVACPNGSGPRHAGPGDDGEGDINDSEIDLRSAVLLGRAGAP